MRELLVRREIETKTPKPKVPKCYPKYTRGIARHPLVTLSQNTNNYFKKTLITRHKLH